MDGEGLQPRSVIPADIAAISGGSRYYARDHISEGTYGAVTDAVDLTHPAATAFVNALLCRYAPPTPPREARVARKALSSSSGSTKLVLREVSVLQRIRKLQDSLDDILQCAPPDGQPLPQMPVEAEAFLGSRYCLRLLDVEQRASGYPNIISELCDTTLLGFMKCFKDRRAPLCCVRTFAAQLAEAVAFLHDSVGVVHRDLKPDNVLLRVVEDTLPAMHQAVGTPFSSAVDDGDDDEQHTCTPSLNTQSFASQQPFLSPALNSTSSAHLAPVSPPRPAQMDASGDEVQDATMQTPQGNEINRHLSAVEAAGPRTQPGFAPAHQGSAVEALGATAPRRPVPPPAARPCDLCPFCGSRRMAGDGEPLETFEGPPAPRNAAHREGPTAAAEDRIEGTYLDQLLNANGVDRRGVNCSYRHASPASSRLRLEVRICDFGSACFVGPQPVVPEHGVGEAPLGSGPACAPVLSVDSGATLHTMAATMAPPPRGDEENRAGWLPDPPQRPSERLDRLHRPYVTHGWTTLQYRAPEDLISTVNLEERRPSSDVVADIVRPLKPRLGTSIDVWALGAILVEMLTGEIVFYDGTVHSMQDQDSPWPQIMAILRVMGSPECGSEQRGSCTCCQPGDACTSNRCWPGLLTLAARKTFCVPTKDPQAQSSSQQATRWVLKDVTHRLDADGSLVALPHFTPSLHRAGRGSLATRCVQHDAVFVQPMPGALRSDVDELVQAIAPGVQAKVSPTFDLVSRLLVLDPARRLCAGEALDHPALATVLEQERFRATCSAQMRQPAPLAF